MQRSRFLIISAALLLMLGAPALAAGDAGGKGNAPTVQADLNGKPVKGKVAETINAAGYTYLLVDTSQGKVWVAIPETRVTVGQEVVCNPGMAMTNFQSKTLKRTFDTIIFSSGLGGEGRIKADPHAGMGGGGESFADALQAEGAASPHGGMGAGMGAAMAGSAANPSGSAGAIVPSADIKVEKAKGGNAYTVGECFDQAAKLNGKKVRVRGQVMKVSHMIMGKNWVHLQDGSGNPLKNTHDLVITTMADPKVGSVVVVEGTLHANKDFGAGYKYDAIIEDATIK